LTVSRDLSPEASAAPEAGIVRLDFPTQAIIRAEDDSRRFKDLVEVTTDWIWEVDEHTRYTYASPKVFDLLGYRPEEVLGKTPFDFMSPDEARRVAALFEEIARAQRPFHLLENTNLHKDGRRVVLETSGVPLFDAAGVFRGYRGVDRDITVYLAEIRLRHEAAEFRNELIRAAGEGICACVETPEFPYVRFEVWNDRMVDLTGYTVEEINRLGWYQSLYPDTEVRERAIARMERMRQGVQLEAEPWAITRKDGDQRLVSITTSAVVLKGNAAATVAVLRDMTDQLRAVAALRESEARFRLIAENATDVIQRIAPDGRCLYCSPSTATILGGSPSETCTRNFAELIHPEDRTPLVAAWQRLLAGDESDSATFRVRRDDGTYRWVESRAKPIREPDTGALKEVMVVTRDITERRAIEDRLRQAQKMDAIGRLAGVVAHEFNNLLTAIRGYTGLLKDSRNLPPSERDWVAQCDKGAQVATELTRQLLAFARRQSVAPVEVPLGIVVREMLPLLSRLVGKQVVVRLRPAESVDDDAGPWVHGDRSQIEQVLVNFVLNARDAMPGGGEIEVGLVETGGFEQRDALAGLEVLDTGTGIDDEVRGRLFEPFVTTKPGATGLGLATAYAIVVQSGGRIDVDSTPGSGSRFTAWFRRAIGHPVIAAPASAAAEPRTPSILLVEDEEIVRDMLASVLRSAGYQLHVAQTAREATERFFELRGEVDVLVSDVVMPGMGGRELAGIVRAIRPATRVLLISGYARESAELEGSSDEEFEFIQKPFSPTELLSRLKLMLAG
jgi:two-component system, cell cycle sensor histidine kinase and response regulator CckA